MSTVNIIANKCMKFSNNETTSALLMIVASEHGYHYQYLPISSWDFLVNIRHVRCIIERDVVWWWLQVKKFVFDGSEDFLELAQVASHASPERMGGGKWSYLKQISVADVTVDRRWQEYFYYLWMLRVNWEGFWTGSTMIYSTSIVSLGSPAGEKNSSAGREVHVFVLTVLL